MTTIYIGILIACVLLFFAMRGQSLAVLREFRTSLRGYSDLLTYAAVVEDGIVLNKDGSLLAAWSYRGNDLDSASGYELDALSSRVNAALKRRGTGWMMHVDAVRREARSYSTLGSFPDRTTGLIDAERRAQYESEGAHYETIYVLCVTFLPAADREDKFGEFFVEGERSEDSPSARAMRTFKAGVQDLEDTLSLSLRFKRLKSRTETDAHGKEIVFDDLLRHLTHCVTGVDHPVRLPDVPMYLDAMIGATDFFGGLKPRVGDLSIRAISLTGFPNQSYPGILDSLSRMAIPFRWSNRFIFMDPFDARKHLEKRRKKWFTGRKSMRGMMAEQSGGGAASINNDANRMAEDAQEALDDLSGDIVRFGFYTSVVVLMHEDPAVVDEYARETLKILFNVGFNARIEGVNAVEAFMGTHPGNGYANVRKPIVHTRNVADFIPTTTIWPGAETNPCPFYPPKSPPLAYTATSGATPFRLNLHVGDVGHTLILGPTGAGKSTLLGLIAASHFRYPNAQVFIFDKGYSAYPLVKAAGGEHYDILGEVGSPQFCPLARIDEPGERVWAAEWLETLIALQGVQLNPAHRKAIYHALTLLADSPSRTMTDLLHGPLQEPELRAALDRYTLDGPLGMLIDSQTDGLGDDMFQVFELEHLMESGASSARNVVPILLYLFHRIEQRLDGRPTLLVLDEAWTFIDNSLFAEKIRDWLKTLRKKNAAVVFATQSVSDVLAKPITAAILESCLTKIYLPNPEARSQNSSAAYRQIGLSDRQIEILSYAVPKRQYYYTSVYGQRLFDLGLGPVAISFIGASGKDDLREVTELANFFGSDWPAEWLWQRNLQVAAAHWVAGGETERDAALSIMQHNRQTWPAEWLRYKGMHAESAAWMAYYERRMATATAAAAEAETAGSRYGSVEALSR
jgi:type IV secretion/conjugal transfer VirB4 family ATPase